MKQGVSIHAKENLMPLWKCFDYILRTHVNDYNSKAGRRAENTK